MSAYVISEVEILDEAAAARYRELAAASITAHGGRYIVRGAEPLVAEGEPTRRRVVIVEFPSMEQLHHWYTSADYAAALRFRHTALERRLMFVQGLSPSP